jgi:hypothetical protein
VSPPLVASRFPASGFQEWARGGSSAARTAGLRVRDGVVVPRTLEGSLQSSSDDTRSRKARLAEPYGGKVVDVVDDCTVVVVVVGGTQSSRSGFAAQAFSESFLQAFLHLRLTFPLRSPQSVRQDLMSLLQSLLHFFFFAASADAMVRVSAQSRIRNTRISPVIPIVPPLISGNSLFSAMPVNVKRSKDSAAGWPARLQVRLEASQTARGGGTQPRICRSELSP